MLCPALTCAAGSPKQGHSGGDDWHLKGQLQPWVDESGVDDAFDDVAQLARGCRFGDCRHVEEPGCAVREAVDSGVLDPNRLEHYRRLLREAAFERRKRDKSAAVEEQRRWKRISQS